ncbi:FkbM family methyltransferase [Candidatus Hepatincola sp. Av]
MFTVLKKGLIKGLACLIPIRSWRVKFRSYMLQNTLSESKEQQIIESIHDLKKNVINLQNLLHISSLRINAILETLLVQEDFTKTALKEINYHNKAILLKYRVASQVDFLSILNENFNNKRIGNTTANTNIIHSYTGSNYEFKEGDIVLDVGANIGMYSIKLLQHFPFVKIYAFEPILENFELLCENIRLNNLEKNIIPINKAICSHNNGVYMKYLPFFPAGSSSNNLLIERRNSLQYYSVLSEKPIFVESTTLDAFLQEHNIDKVKLIKMDCEGAEKEIIYNTKVLPKFEYFVVELHFSKTENNEIIDYLKKFFPKDRLFIEELNHYQDK